MKSKQLLNSRQAKILFYIFFTITILFAQSNLQLKFSQEKAKTGTSFITISLFNDSTESIKVLRWNTAFENTISADILNINNGKSTMKYLGRVVKRSHPTQSDYMTLQAGETRTVSIDISKYYQLETEGEYSISYKGVLKTFSPRLQKAVERTLSKGDIPSIRIFLTPSKTQKKTTLTSSLSAKVSPAFNACSQSQITVINTAHDEAIIIALDAKNTMDAAPLNTLGERYRTWFGAPDSARQSTVTTHFSNIYSALDTQNVAFDCTCTQSYFAYVYPSQPYTIYLCNSFWTANVSGTDSQAGTLVHEMSHFTVVAGTDDHVYGQSGAKNLANTNPNNAVFNADSHEYFAENTPYLNMDNKFDAAVFINDIINDLPFAGSIDISGEKDIYEFIPSQTGYYTFSTSGSLDTLGTLYSATYNELVKNDDNGSGYNFQLSATLLQGQTYYIEVSGYSTNTGAYSLQSISARDYDLDGIPDSVDTDDDNDGVLDMNDAFPLNATESVDTDGDGIGNNADTDDDNDGILDTVEVLHGLNPLDASDASADFDNDGFNNAVEINLGTDIRNAASKPSWAPIFTGDGLVILVPYLY
jgi:peptidyl-Lys metalloendopeptidase